MNIWIGVIVTLGLALAACGGEKREKKATPPNEVTPESPPPVLSPGEDASAGTISGPHKTMAQCNAEGKAWIAVVNSGNSPPTCAGPLASWGCCEAQIMARFPRRTDLKEMMDRNIDKGLKLYNCEAIAPNQHKLHFVGYPAPNRTEYAYLTIPDFPTDPTGAVEDCPQVPSEFAGSEPPSGGSGSEEGESSDPEGAETEDESGD